MENSSQGLSIETLADRSANFFSFVSDLNRRNPPPEAALAELKELGAGSPGFAPALVWDREEASGKYSYCLLVATGSETFSVSATENGALPWSLRGGVRLDSNILATVNGNPLTVVQAITYIDAVLNKGNLLSELVDFSLMSAAAKHYEIPVSRDRLDAATANYFTTRGIAGKAEIATWLAQRGLTMERFRTFIEDGMRSRAVERVLASTIPASKEDSLPDAMASAPVSRLRVPAPLAELAQQLMCERPRDDLASLAHRLAEACGFTAAPALEFVRLLRVELAELAPERSDFPVGVVLVSAASPAGLVIVQVLGMVDRPSPAQVAARQLQRAVQRWYETGRAAARIEWNWGGANFGTMSLPRA